MTAEAYRDVGRFIDRFPTITDLELRVVDNTFDSEKARILYEILSRSRITSFDFINLAIAVNERSNEADDFLINIAPIKSLNFPTNLTWELMHA